MKNFLLFMGLLACPFLNAQSVTSIDDAYINAGASAGVNYGTVSSMPVKNSSPDYTRHVLLKFDLSTFDAGVAEDYILNSIK